MDLGRHVAELRRQLAIAAEGGGEEARALAERLVAPLEAAFRLTLLDVLGEAAAEITRELAPGSVEVRLRGRDAELVVSPRPPEPVDEAGGGTLPGPFDGRGAEDAAMSRINLRLPEQLKDRIDLAADRDGLSVNAWLTRAAAAAVDRSVTRPGPGGRGARGGQRYRGWAR